MMGKLTCVINAFPIPMSIIVNIGMLSNYVGSITILNM